jgi:thiol:disulfide interchange protein DsbD
VQETATTPTEEKSRGLLGIFLIAFFSGFAALLTPCVFPMIPMTVSFFTKQSKTKAAGIRNAIIYGLSIIIIYVLLGTLVSAVFGADALNALATNVWFNIIFFLLLVVFAISFMGAFEITLPQSWANKADSKANKGGLLGIFFMALALAIVSFSCTGPIVGYLLVEAASKGGIAPIIGMLGFSLAIALPFALFAMFPGWLNSLPKSGGWLNTVKVVLGFLELALAFKFLSQADLVLQTHFLEREVFIAIWIAVFGGLAMYLFGKIKLPHDGPLSHISVGRLLLGLLTLSFVVYMIPGLWGAPLNLISAFPPPQEYSESPYGVGYSKLGGGGTADHGDLPDGAHLLAPHDILAFNDYAKGLAYAKEVKKPVLIDFTGWACVNCRKMEQNVWPKDRILPILKKDVVLISLYVDDKRSLPEGEKYTSEETGKKIKTIGNKWSDFQIKRYKANAQPFYVLMDLDENNLNKPVGYTPDAADFRAWLEDGISKFPE